MIAEVDDHIGPVLRRPKSHPFEVNVGDAGADLRVRDDQMATRHVCAFFAAKYAARACSWQEKLPR